MTDSYVPPFSGEVRDPDKLRAEEASYGGLADSVRRLINATLRTKVDPAEVDKVTAEVDRLTEILLVDAREGSLGLRVCSDGKLRDHGNAASGMRNPLAPPLKIKTDRETRRASVSFTSGAGHEGPPGHVHGGIIALVLDQVLGSVPPLRDRPGMTAYLNLTYRRPTPLGESSAEAWIAEEGEWKTLVRGHLKDAQGRVTVEAEGMFVVPRMARERFSLPHSDAGEFSYPVMDPSDAG